MIQLADYIQCSGCVSLPQSWPHLTRLVNETRSICETYIVIHVRDCPEHLKNTFAVPPARPLGPSLITHCQCDIASWKINWLNLPFYNCVQQQKYDRPGAFRHR
ncbi:hypothetical protein BLOT_012269 [Blomia tropicalis]|nr:hypothetical protein BLOT_012269 [Blomia tropicalis]